MFKKVLIANRGAIACRIIRSLRKMGVQSVAVYSEADQNSLHVAMADQAVCIGPAPASQSYLLADKILEVARQTGAEAIHPGYGFLSENADFAAACEAAGVAFIGPTPEQMRAFGLKHTARELAQKSGVPLLPGTGLLADVNEALQAAEQIGYPVMLKSTAGGGGIGMQLCEDAAGLQSAYASVARLAANNFKESGIYLEKFVRAARHIEVQIFGDGLGHVVALGERDCSLQRRNQKVVEETPAPGLTDMQRAALYDTAIRLGQSVNYRSAGTVEFVFDVAADAFYFLEVNTRLQVEHGVTEEVTGVDLVEWMISAAAQETLPLHTMHLRSGHSIQVRLYAEDPNKQFQPSTGRLTEVSFSPEARIETWVENGSEVTPYYDPMLAKIIVHAADREAALAKMAQVLDDTRIAGIETNLDYLRQVVRAEAFTQGRQITQTLNQFVYQPNTVDVIEAGLLTTVQDYPGRIGYWAVGVPPSGAMDMLGLRLANRLVGNAADAAGLEITVSGPTLKFNRAVVVAVTGANIPVTLDGEAVTMYQAILVKAGSTLAMGRLGDTGCRAYLAISGGLDVPLYLGSRSTFTLGQFGGHGGRALRAGDVLPLAKDQSIHFAPLSLASELQPKISNHWEIGVLYGPHGAPDFFTDDDIVTFFAADWKVHYNSNPTGVRLIGPKPQWARRDGGEAGLHPSNLHDNAYAIGAIDFTGDMPVILGPDGPSLGGFVCPAVIVDAELWKVGQLRPGDTIRFIRMSPERAAEMLQALDTLVADLKTPLLPSLHETEATPAVIFQQAAQPDQFAVTYRRAGDQYLLVEYGEMMLDIALRFRVHALMQWMERFPEAGVIDLTPGIRSLQIHFDSRVLPASRLIALLQQAETELPPLDAMEVPSRIVHLPLSWDNETTRTAIDKYMQSVRPDAPWCPSNIEFIRRINGLDSIEEVKDIIFGASYLVLGLGDVYLGAPVATPMDPRHRLVTTKYNPARTWTAENSVGIGGAYMCVYGMEGPGGYQLVGRTVQMWNRDRSTLDFPAGKPWLLRLFDQIRFYPVSDEELTQMRADFPQGRFHVKTTETTLRLSEYQAFLAQNQSTIKAFKMTQQAAFDAERERWVAAGQAEYMSDEGASDDAEVLQLPDNASAISAPVAGNVWRVEIEEGATVKAGDVLVIIESMKMEFNVLASKSGQVVSLNCKVGTPVQSGEILLGIV